MRISLIDGLKDDEFCIYFSKSYQKLFARIYNSNFQCIKISKSGKTFFLPLIIRKLKDNNYEAFSSYGYGGLIGEETKLSIKEIKSLRNFLSGENIHSLFIRHSPFLENHNFWPDELIEENRFTYETTLTFASDYSSFKKSLRQKLRSSINHAEKNNFLVDYLEKPQKSLLMEFYKLYRSRMKDLSSPKFYFFDYQLFQDHFVNFSERCKLLLVKNSESKIVAGAIFLCDPKSKIVHYHLSASSREGLKHQCNELLMTYAMFIFGKNGYKKMHLGGGIKYDESDGLSRFKRKFANKKNIFYLTKLICNSDLYFQTRSFYKLINREFFLIGDALEEN